MSSETVTEKALMETIIEAAHLYGWKTYHTYDSRRSEPGYPDLALCRPPRYVLIECKTETGRLTEHQVEWGLSLTECPGVEYYLVRPTNLDPILERLR